MSAAPTWSDLIGRDLLDLATWDALPEDPGRRLELAEGVIVVAARPVSRHQLLLLRLAGQLDARSAERWATRPEYEVLVDEGPPPTVRVPDVVLARPDLPDHAQRARADELVGVVEILSPGSRRLDRVLKLHEYAEAGVPWYLLVEPGPPVVLTEFSLVGGADTRVAEHRGTAAPGLGATVDLDALG